MASKKQTCDKCKKKYRFRSLRQTNGKFLCWKCYSKEKEMMPLIGKTGDGKPRKTIEQIQKQIYQLKKGVLTIPKNLIGRKFKIVVID